LINFLPLIIKDIVVKIPKKDWNRWKLILLIIDIVKLTFATKITKNMLTTLEKSITEHHQLLISVYSVHLIPKDHILLTNSLSNNNKKNGTSKNPMDNEV
ncbi:GSCOCG00012441001-RA-CDS, partial [Cotesia congregata]